MADPALVSVVIPVFNTERFVAAAVASVLAQSHRPIEVIVVDDGSTDGSAAAVQTLGAEVRLLRHEGNLGPAAARNTGVEASTGDLVSFLDADDLMAPGRLLRHTAHLGENDDVGYVLGRQQLILEQGQTVPSWLIADFARRTVIDVHPLGGTARRSALERVGPFDTALRVGEDLDWLFRCRESGVGVAVLDEVSVIRRIHDANICHQATERGLIAHGVLGSVRGIIRRRRVGTGGDGP